MKHILFVCTGNICRSPMAEALFRHAVRGREDVAVSSAGVSAMHGAPPSPEAVLALREDGIDLSHHRSRPLTDEIVEKASFIFAMTMSHLKTIQAHFPQASEKVFLLREFDDSPAVGEREIPDPIGLGQQAYQECREAIRKALPGALRFIQQADDSLSMREQSAPPHPLRVAIGADHGGFELKRALVDFLKTNGYAVTNAGADRADPAGYPDFAEPVCRKLAAGAADFGVLVCATGIGMSIAANRNPQIRASLVHNTELARVCRRQNNSNVLCLGADTVDPVSACKILDAFLTTAFEGGSHQHRMNKMSTTQTQSGRSPRSLESTDPEIAAAILAEVRRQSENIELIASENFTSQAVMEAQGSVLTNKYAEGYPGRRWYGGCENVDVVEQLAIDRAKQLFGADHVNVQPHSGSQANMAVYFSVLEIGDRILTMDLAHGGHLTHGHKANFSGKLYEVAHYGVSRTGEQIDYDALAQQAGEFKPRMITVGASAYPRVIDFARMREIADSVGAWLFADMAHIAGLVAGGVHPSPVPHADFVTTTTHKSLRGPRGGLILCKEEYAKKIDSLVFPGVQGGPLMHVIAAKAVCLLEALQPEFKDYARQIVSNAKSLAARLGMLGYRLVSGGTDNHLLLVDVRPANITGKDAQETLDRAGITVNKNAIPFDTMPIMKTGGIRIGTPAVTTRGMKEEDMMEIADLIHQALEAGADDTRLAEVKKSVLALTARHPLP